MKRLICATMLLLCFVACLIVGAACDTIRAQALGVPADSSRLTTQDERNPLLGQVERSANDFAYRFAQQVRQFGDADNFVVSPLSVYMALAMASECIVGATQDELLDVLGTDFATVSGGLGLLYRRISDERSTSTGKVSSCARVYNSLWLGAQVPFKQPCIDALANDMFCHSYAADFANDNARANADIRKLVKRQTNDLIDVDFDLPADTLFAIVNALYVKDNWNIRGSNLPFDDGEHTFTSSDGSAKSVQLLQSYYFEGKAQRNEVCSYFYATTAHGYTIKFMLPNDGYTAADALSARNLAEVNATADYGGTDEAHLTRYKTRCLFPQFSADFNRDIAGVLRDMGISLLFDPETCDLSALTDWDAFCGKVLHVARLNVDRKGLEGAAVTVLQGAGAPGPDEYTIVYDDFVVDRAFAFVLTDAYDNMLFCGAINDAA